MSQGYFNWIGNEAALQMADRLAEAEQARLIKEAKAAGRRNPTRIRPIRRRVGITLMRWGARLADLRV